MCFAFFLIVDSSVGKKIFKQNNAPEEDGEDL